MVTNRTAKSKGNQFEYICQENLQEVYGEDKVTRTSERGYQLQYDLRIDVERGEFIAVECKREAGFSWNKLKKYFEKLKHKTPDAISHYLLFKGNRQPCLVMYSDSLDFDSPVIVCEFKTMFNVEFRDERRKKIK